MKQAIFKIMLLLTVIFMRIEVAEAVSYNHPNKIQTSSTISNQTNTDEYLNLSIRLWIKLMICLVP